MPKKKVKTIEDIKPSEMFGNPVLIKKLDEERKEQEFIKNSEECPRCDGKKTVYHECDCQFCSETYEDCERC